ncbi:MAG: hypothetical protein ACOYM3_04185 [Terrimicrobiaceae bacterium]
MKPDMIGRDAQYFQFCHKSWHGHPAHDGKITHGQDAHATYPDRIGRDAIWFIRGQLPDLT